MELLEPQKLSFSIFPVLKELIKHEKVFDATWGKKIRLDLNSDLKKDLLFNYRCSDCLLRIISYISLCLYWTHENERRSFKVIFQ